MSNSTDSIKNFITSTLPDVDVSDCDVEKVTKGTKAKFKIGVNLT